MPAKEGPRKGGRREKKGRRKGEEREEEERRRGGERENKKREERRMKEDIEAKGSRTTQWAWIRVGSWTMSW